MKETPSMRRCMSLGEQPSRSACWAIIDSSSLICKRHRERVESKVVKKTAETFKHLIVFIYVHWNAECAYILILTMVVNARYRACACMSLHVVWQEQCCACVQPYKGSPRASIHTYQLPRWHPGLVWTRGSHSELGPHVCVVAACL